MQTYPLSDRFLNKIMDITNPILGKLRQKRLNNKDFTIISNNCWAGICYEYYGLPKLSPTVGLYFYADEYIKFVKNLDSYLQKELIFINFNDSIHKKDLIRKNQTKIPIGLLNDIEIIFLHYKNEHEASEKWKRRIHRINWHNMIYKFSFMNECKEENILEFQNICSSRGGKYFSFVPYLIPNANNTYIVKADDNGQISNDTFYWNRYFDVEAFLNK